jgi:malate dehydrogenase (oxaloacetate-decarboxylating)
MDFEFAVDKDGKPYLKVYISDYALLSHPLLNKGMAFTREEREAFGLIGLIPPHQSTMQIQLQRSYQAFKSKPSDIEKYIYLRDLQDSNEVLFYNLLCNHISEMMPIVYTPTVGLGCERYSNIYRRPRGVYIAYPDINNIDKILANSRFDNVRAIVVSDGERILGLGDQGAGGMGIPVGKLALYTACAGIHPASTLPILLDTGTNNPNLVNDPLYIGWHHERIRGEQYYKFIDAFVKAVNKRFSHVLLQWEDFAQQNANPILQKYREQICTFNDDIQGTAAVAAGALFAAIHVTKTSLNDQRIVVVGAGSAGCGISQLILRAMMREGLSEQQARERFFLIDRTGLLTQDMQGLAAFQLPFAQPKEKITHWKLSDANHITLLDVMNNVHPTVLIGVSGQPRIFTEEIVRTMAKHVAHPVIFPLSNPTDHSEATPEDLMQWTDGKALIGTGSPFKDIIKNGHPFRVDQTNNSYIFPGVGLAIIATRAKHITDNMFMAAALALADCSPTKTNPQANLLPPLTEIRQVSLRVALAVAKEAFATDLAQIPMPEDLEEHIRSFMWVPEYLPYKKS